MGGSVQAMMRAAGYSNEKEFFKAVEEGKVLTKDVLPKFSEELKKMSKAGGALDKTMESTPAQFQRFMNAITEAKLVFYENGMDKGMAYFFKEFTTIIQDLNPAIKAFGKIFQGVAITLTAAFKLISVPLQFIVDLFGSFDQVLKELGIEDGTGTLWKMVGAGGVLVLMATRFSFVTKAVWSLNAALLTTLARLAPFIAAYAALEDVFIYMKYGDNADTVTGTAIKGLSENSVGRRYLSKPETFKDDGWFSRTIGSQMGMFEMWKAVFTGDRSGLTITVNDSEFAKAITVTTDRNNQAKTAATQSEVSQ